MREGNSLMIIIECETMCRMPNVISYVHPVIATVYYTVYSVAMERTTNYNMEKVNCARVHLSIFDNVIEYSLTCSSTYELIIHLFLFYFYRPSSSCLSDIYY